MSIKQNSRVFVIGGSSGIGEATARRAAEAGAAVTIASRSKQHLAAAIERLPSGIAARVLDVTDVAMVQDFFGDGAVWDHIVVAGAATNTGPVRGLPVDDAYGAMASKFWGPYHVARCATFGEGGSLTLVSGVYSIRPSKHAVLQGAINAALEALARGLALELAPIRVNTVSPSLTATPLWDRLAPADRAAMFKSKAGQLPTSRTGNAEDIADPVLFLAGNPFATGSTVLVDGGDALV